MGIWSKLQVDLLELILEKLYFVDVIRFKAVCCSWNSVAEACIPSSGIHFWRQSPCLLLPAQGEEDDGESFRFFSLEDEKVYKLKNMPEKFQGGLCMGSSHGWLVYLDKQLDICLLNPFSLAQIPLPSLRTFPSIEHVFFCGKPGVPDNFYKVFPCFKSDGYVLCCNDKYGGLVRHIRSINGLREDFLNKAILSSNPSHSSSNVRVLIVHEVDWFKYRLAFCNSGDSKWTDTDACGNISDVICYNDQFYVLLDLGRIEIWDYHTSSFIRTKEINSPLREEIWETARSLPYSCSIQSYLVESSGELLNVVRFTTAEYDRDDNRYKTKLFHVYKLDFNQERWVQVESLNERALFVGMNHSFSVCAKDIPHCKENSIYFTDDISRTQRRLKNKCYDDLGIFNLEDKSVERFYQGELLINEMVPVWVYS